MGLAQSLDPHYTGSRLGGASAVILDLAGDMNSRRLNAVLAQMRLDVSGCSAARTSSPPDQRGISTDLDEPGRRVRFASGAYRR